LQARIGEFHHTLEHALDGIDLPDTAARIRLTHSLDMLKGTRTIYPQQPSILYYPYLAQRQFFERDEFGWVEEIEAATPTIRDELVALINADAEFRPYVQDVPNRPQRDFHRLNNDPSWSALYLWKDGKLVEENAARCPATVAALGKVPLSRIGSRTPAVLFSRLEPGAHIPGHSGMLNSRLICHLPLIVPPGCWLRVGNETREVQEGKLLIFDDSIEHEAKNPSAEMRIILLFDVWRPELSEAERRGISAMFDAIDAFQALPDA
jgi:aspartyl/asparaginyl beta-hydroxylase (cupin superfamily)